MENQEDLTNEDVKKKFKSQFELVGYAIKLAENMIRTGRSPRIKSDSQNVAIHVLDEIKAGMDKFEDIPKEPKQEPEYLSQRPMEKKESFKDATKLQERKRTRKILVD